MERRRRMEIYHENGMLAELNYKNSEQSFCTRFLISFPKLRDSNQVLAVFLSF